MTRLTATLALVAGLGALTPAAAQSTGDEVFRNRLAIAQARLTLNVVQRLATADKPMLVVSPASLAGAAAALDLGASAQLRGAMHGVLGFRRNADVAADLAALRASVRKLADAPRPDAPLRFATSVVFDHAVPLYPGVPLALAQAGMDHAVLDTGAADTAEKINKRFRDLTAGLIPEMVDRSSAASLLVLNALYFKDKWQTPFDRAATAPAPFRRVGGKQLTVSTMHLPQGKYRFRQDTRFMAIELPYATDRFSMVVVTTRGERPAPVSAFRAAGDWLSGSGFAVADGELALPHFDVSQREDLLRVLDGLGLRQARLSPDALSGFSSDPARVTRVLQRVELRVNEEGTQAAAATTVAVERSVDANYVRMVVDRPFMFALRDAVTGLILVAGYVGQPTPLATAAQ
jgi:serine protease inhibitor